MRKAIIVVSLFLMAGCAPNYIKVSRLDAQGQYIPFATAKIDGCLVEVKGDLVGIEIEYKDEKCVVKYGDKN